MRAIVYNLVLVFTALCSAFAQQSQPLGRYLTPDGKLNTPPGFSGSLDPGGWQLVAGPEGNPKFVSAGAGQMTDPADSAWDERFNFPGLWGAGSQALALLVHGGNLYVGGAFKYAGKTVANNIARWDGSTWSALGSGFNSVVTSLAVVGGDLYAGGWFQTAGDDSMMYIARWDGSTWSPVGSGMNASVYALAEFNGDLYAGGSFTIVGGASIQYLARWDGSAWSQVGAGVNHWVYSLLAKGGELYAGGIFTIAGGVIVNYVARWNGSSWSPLGIGTNSHVYALAADDSALYAGGAFSAAGGAPATRVARWNGTNWSGYTGLSVGWVNSLLVYDGALHAGGGFSASGLGDPGIARWNGSGWSGLGSGANNEVRALAAWGKNLVAGGPFSIVDGKTIMGIGEWDGSGWTPLLTAEGGQGPNGTVLAIAVSGEAVYIGGGFTSVGEVEANNIARWDGQNWSALGSGTNSGVYALAVKGTEVYAGGTFSQAGGVPVSSVAKWDGSNWSALGGSTNGAVEAFAVIGTDIYAGGTFTTIGGVAANYVAKWNGSAWSALGSGMARSDAFAPQVECLVAKGADLYAGGFFMTAGGIPANNIAKWNGIGWSALGSGTDGSVWTLSASASHVFAAGVFTTAGGNSANRVAAWDGSGWAPLGVGVDSAFAQVYALSVSGEDLYVGGNFTSAGGSASPGIARWNGTTWSSLGSGLDYIVMALAASGMDLYLGGQFLEAGDTPSSRFARWEIGEAPDWSWARSAGGVNTDRITGVAGDDSGNTYVTGLFEGTIDFGGGPITSAGSRDFFLAKYDAAGSHLWSLGGGGTGLDNAAAVARDGSGGIFVVGNFLSPTITIDTISLPAPSATFTGDVFLARFDAAGRAIWARAAGDGDVETATDVAVDSAGKVYIAGQFRSATLQFGSTPPLTNNGLSTFDSFVARYDPSGNAEWSNNIGSAMGDDVSITSIDVTSAGELWFTGSLGSAVNFGWYNSAGVRTRTSIPSGRGESIAIDDNGHVYLAGSFPSSSITIGSTTLTNAGGAGGTNDIFIAESDTGFNFLWARQAGGVGIDAPAELILDNSGSLYLAGHFASPALGLGSFTLSNSSPAEYDVFLARYDTTGASAWIRRVGSTLSEISYDLAVDIAGNILLGGYFASPTVEFGGDLLTNESAGTSDGFLAKLGNEPIGLEIDQSTSLLPGWNLVSLPVTVVNDSVSSLFPLASSNAFAYTETGYETRPTCEVGVGYWLKFPSANKTVINGYSVSEATIPVFEGWNLIGTVATPIAAAGITSDPPGIVTGNFFGYAGSYITADTLIPGSAYWVKVDQAGELHLSSSPVMPAAQAGRIRIVPTGELPPPHPDEFGGTDRQLGVPTKVSLDQNYPNPFNPSTTIRYAVPALQHVSLKVYTVIGQELAVLVDGLQDAGFHSVVWNAADLPAGLYFYRLRSGRFEETRKVLLIK